MRDSDLADSPLASYRPDISGGVDQLPDYLRERIAVVQSQRLPLPTTFEQRTEQMHQVLEDAIADMEGEPRKPTPGPSKRLEIDVIVPVLKLIDEYSNDSQLRMHAICLLRLLEQDGRTFAQIAADCGVTSRACPHAVYRKIQRRLGLRARGDKSDGAREKCRVRRTGQIREKTPWSGIHAWKNTTSLPLPPLALN